MRAALESEYELLTFHATGAGGKAMEKLALTLTLTLALALALALALTLTLT